MAQRIALIEQIAGIVETLASQDGIHPTLIPFLTVVRRSQPTSSTTAVLTPSFCLIAQGTKQIHLGQDVVRYRAGQFIASMIDLPASGNIVDATKETPYLGLRVDLTAQEIAAVAADASLAIQPEQRTPGVGAFVGTADVEFLELILRMLRLLKRPKEVDFLATLLKREMIYHLLMGEHARLFLQTAFFDQASTGVGAAIEWIRKNYEKSFTIAELARKNRMSVSSLHHKFRALTTMGPLQYQKQIRLQEARKLLLSGASDATGAAFAVGYGSSSQFSREYRRLFGLPPLQDVKSSRKNPNNGFLQV